MACFENLVREKILYNHLIFFCQDKPLDNKKGKSVHKFGRSKWDVARHTWALGSLAYNHYSHFKKYILTHKLNSHCL